MIYLDFTTKKLQVVLSGAVTTNQMEISVYYYDMIPQATTTLRRGGTKVAMSNNTTDVDIMDAPTLHGTVRNVHTIMIHNKDTVTQTVTVKLDDAGTETILVKQSVAAGESLTYEDNAGWEILSPITPPFVDTTPIVHGSADVTKFLRIEVDGITTSTTRVWTVADADIKPAGHATGLTSTRVPYATGSTGGVLTDSANLTFDGTILTGHTITSSTGVLTAANTATIVRPTAQGHTVLTVQNSDVSATYNTDINLVNSNDTGSTTLISKRLDGSLWLYQSGADTINFYTNGLERIAIATGGGVTIAQTLAVNGNATLGDAVGDSHTITGAVTITDDSVNAISLSRSGGGDRINIGAQGAGSGSAIVGLNDASSDYTSITVQGNVFGIYCRTGVGTVAEIGRFTSAGLIFPTDNTYDIGASGATRARDFHLARNALVGGTLGVTGALTATGGLTTGSGTLTTIGRQTTGVEGAQIALNKASDNTTAWNIDIFNDTSVDLFRIFAASGNVLLQASPPSIAGPVITVAAAGAVTLASTLGAVGSISSTGGDIDATRSSAGGSVVVTASNTENANAASHAILRATAGGASGGDPKVQWIINGVTTWSAGLDNSSSDNFTISASATLGTSNVLTIDSSGNTNITGTFAVSGIGAIGAATSSTTNLNLPAGTTGVSSLRVAHGSAPTSPVNGDVWTTTGGVFARINSATEGPYIAAATTNTLTNKSIDGATNTITNIAQGALKTTTGDVSNSFTIASHLTLPGGTYGWYPQTWISGGNATTGQVIISNPVGNVNTSAVTLIYVDATGMSQGSLNARQRYVQASPPYNLGNGDIPLFIFALVDSLGHIKSTYIAPDPPWANNGPTDIRADYYRNGTGFKKPQLTHEQQIRLRDPKQRDAVLRELAETEDVELTYAVKNSNMLFIPHPFTNTVGMTVILLDTLTTFGDHIGDLHAAGERISDFLHEGDIVVDNVPINCITPPGVIAVAASWKLT